MFTRDFVSPAAGDEAAGYYQQLGMLDNGDGESFCLLFGLYRRLVNEAGKRSRAYRGYLIDADERPLTDSAIGRLLKINPKRISTLLRKLELVKLLEHVTMPDKFDTSLNEQPKENKKQSHSGGRGRKRSAESGGGRKRAEISARGRKPLKKTKTATATRTKNSTSTEISNEQFDNGKKGKRNNNGKRSGDKANALSSPEAPATTPPIQSRESAKGGGVLIEFPAPSRAVFNNRCDAGKLGDIAQGMLHRYSSDARDFGGEIYLALELRFAPTSTQGRRELGCFGSLWERVKVAGLPPAALAELRSRAVLEAGKLAKRKSQCKNRSAVFCHIFARLVNAAGVTARTDRGAG